MKHARLFLSLALAVVGAKFLAWARSLMEPEVKRYEADGLSLRDVYSAKLTEREAAYIIRVQKWHMSRCVGEVQA
jgi:hypothetical protein